MTTELRCHGIGNKDVHDFPSMVISDWESVESSSSAKLARESLLPLASESDMQDEKLSR